MTRSPVWHPFTQHALEPPAIEVTRTEGAWLETRDGRRLFDGIASWWVITHGHRQPHIMAAIRTATENLDQVIFAGFTHAPAEQLAHALVRLAPAGLEHVFYSDSGSTAVEVALKMALGTARARGERRDRIVVMEHSYHGDTIGAMSVGARGVFNAPYEPLLFAVDTIPFPVAGQEQATLDAFEQVARAGRAAALIVEPLVLGAGGMLMYPPAILAELRRIAAATGILFIADEVMTGWGRTGTLFACDQAGIAPDILCTSKGLTGGAIPLAATLASAAVFDAHYSEDRARTFYHSSSYTANPIACAAALANVEVWQAEPVAERVATLARRQRQQVEALAGRVPLANVRTCGTIAAADVPGAAQSYLAAVGPRIRQHCLQAGVFVRPMGNVVYLMPPYCTTEAELDLVYGVLEEALRAVAA
ncbi:adenosylmethionine--8-amino-7-oxononanoate transaminase [Zavarzinia sp. CC-PAN008]|uniref:adenosylmethionine--8-amino-7-oxononanoate transaminase n=1 Tax=Zavarzinia sp. CC-PAN008 TaxID=3243332 RepID=UPI003F748CC3